MSENIIFTKVNGKTMFAKMHDVKIQKKKKKKIGDFFLKLKLNNSIDVS